MPDIQLKKGKLLLAHPNNHTDDLFSKSVILLTDHNNKGSIGFVLNKPLKFKLHQIIPDVNCEFTIYNGGPVEQESLYYVHNVPYLIKNSIKITDSLYWGGDFEEIKELLKNKELNKGQIKFFLGYSGWGVYQLNEEIENKNWYIDEFSNNLSVFNINIINYWKIKILEHNPEYALWINAPKNPSLN